MNETGVKLSLAAQPPAVADGTFTHSLWRRLDNVE